MLVGGPHAGGRVSGLDRCLGTGDRARCRCASPTVDLPHQGAWRPTTLLRGEPIQTVEALKEQPGWELQIHGSARLGNTRLAAGLVDTLRLVVAPALSCSGRRLLDHPSGPGGGVRGRRSLRPVTHARPSI
ncbi:dihydrofolate reductase family protein [Pseudonocardia yunnanensis]|uniref:Dihydrofolate reductase family protein n=1 Tax=Pseudonocardia yunnanensis TaxID=58107 RepID=A0ABW4F8B0_9PSEU